MSSGQNDSDKEAVQIKKKEQEKENVAKNQKNHMQRSIYVFVYRWMYDISNLVVFSVLTYGTSLGNSDLGITISNVISIVLSILFAYVTNKLFVFHSKTNSFKELLYEMGKFIGARIATLVIEVGGVWLAVSVIGQDKMIGKLETQVLVVIGNYFISKFLVFTGNKEDKE